MNILIVDRDPAVVDQMQKDYSICPRRNHVVRASHPGRIMGLDLTGWLVMTKRFHYVCSPKTAPGVRQTLIESLK